MDSEKLQQVKAEPKKALEFAHTFKEEGKYAEALEMHEWFHFNCLSIDKAFSGVRLSFALKDWLELADHYPTARVRLIEIRNQNIEEIKKGNWTFEDFNDVVGISRALDDGLTAVEIFKEINKQGMENGRAEKCYSVVFNLLIDFHEKELCRQYRLNDPVQFVKLYKMIFESNLESANRNVQLFKEKESDDPEDVRELETYPQRIYIQSMGYLVQALKFADCEKDLIAVYEAGRGVIPDKDYQKIFEG